MKEKAQYFAQQASNEVHKLLAIGSFRLVSKQCVNSMWTASWLQKKGLEICQCGFECKVRVNVERNGHPPYLYIVTKREYNKLRKELQELNSSKKDG